MASMDPSMRAAKLSSASVMRSQAAERNKDAILAVLLQELPQGKPLQALELASGTGQHVAYFADKMPNVTWQPSECDEKSIKSLLGYHQVTGRSNFLPPIFIDATESPDHWNKGTLPPHGYDLIVCINMIHISEWVATLGLFRGSGYYLKPGGILATYGPYKIHGVIMPDSNVQFDKMLRLQCSQWGLKDTDDLEKLAKENGLNLEKMVDMPANNKTLIFRKT